MHRPLLGFGGDDQMRGGRCGRREKQVLRGRRRRRGLRERERRERERGGEEGTMRIEETGRVGGLGLVVNAARAGEGEGEVGWGGGRARELGREGSGR